ncbi:MAG: UDP-N-acetylmuramoyl-L-alanyl-D-glutamate--2,6-diaminopimelate ligase [Acidimicrobiales bacterium]|jgi:UDP-N-acetylmuramoyl-L-alanyl-D-glutamate--2,6-diaminopimelate ligase
MQLGDVLDDCSLDVQTSSIEIEHVEIDSRRCVPGTLFFALDGVATNGTKFGADAVARGAVAVVASEELHLSVPVIVVPKSQLRPLVAHAAASVTGHPEAQVEMVGVTGTNGKTTVTVLVSALANALGWNGANIGTLTNERTTPSAPELFRSLRQLVDAFDATKDRSVVALEVSSHALVQQRVEGLRFGVVAFTNLSHDHLDYHGSMDEYFDAKAQLFTPEHAQCAVIWCDDIYGERLASSITLGVCEVRRADAGDVVTTLHGTTFFWRGHVINTPLVGDFNVDNALMAMTILSALGANDAAIASAMSDVHNVRGRLEVVGHDDIIVIVDYAHTPDGLQRVLADVRALAPDARIVTVFGCGGDRDRTKRPEMGLVASTWSDVTIVTSDNPRSEAPEDIIDAVMSGVVPGATVARIVDRREAIAQAFQYAQRGDVIVLAGKGHETTQTIGDEVIAFDDREVAMEMLRRASC